MCNEEYLAKGGRPEYKTEVLQEYTGTLLSDSFSAGELES